MARLSLNVGGGSMSETENTNNSAETAKPAKKKSKLLLIIGLLVVLLGAGGGGFYFWNKSKAAAAETAESETEEKKSNSNSKKKPAKEEDETAKESDLPDDEDVKEVVELQPFIVNLADDDSPKYLRMTVSLGIGESEEKPEALFTTRIKNAMLAVLTTKKSRDVLSVEGKTKLRQELLKAAQAASEKPHVEAIYITDFIVQL